MAEALKSRVVATDPIVRTDSDSGVFDTAASYVDHFRARVLQDALTEATSHYWRRRAATFEAARPRAGTDYPGRAIPEQLTERDATLAAVAHACRLRAAFSLLQTDVDPEVLDALAEAA
jgi:hypothetical protein